MTPLEELAKLLNTLENSGHDVELEYSYISVKGLGDVRWSGQLGTYWQAEPTKEKK